ncbi:ABC transporter permease [Saccharopolyspora hirsuta]|uniref:ABC transporter permease n=1 Tax=Saccharopolyspora hirsuta TaxID=1837 RepID=A0A5M7C2U3_SACHI|nr:ABC transporter permease [Saccharopolyspora hirsuta]KAA5836063.1 ABC transporter permease [Saccharopolyspora hirsuta]
MTTAKSAYPVPVEELLPRARQLAADLGRVPGRNKLMNELRIGATKARAILDQLNAERQESAPDSPTRLHLVTESIPAQVGTESETTRDEPGDGHPGDTTSGAGAEAVAGPDVAESAPEPSPAAAAETPQTRKAESEPVTAVSDPAEPTRASRLGKPLSAWPVLLLSLPAFVAIWSGWVGLGGLTGFGIVHPLPGIADGFALNTAITLPIGMETYAAYALRVWMSGQVPARARRFAKWSALGSLLLGALGQIAYHLMKAAGMDAAPWPITALVACLPVAVLGMGAALAHLIKDDRLEVAR